MGGRVRARLERYFHSTSRRPNSSKRPEEVDETQMELQDPAMEAESLGVKRSVFWRVSNRATMPSGKVA